MTTWKFEPGHTAAEFKVKHMMITWVRGSFKNIEGTMEFDPENIEKTSTELSIDVNTLWSGDEARDSHLKGEDFFDVENHPKITFKGDEVTDINENKFKLTGDLTIRGTTKKTTLDVEYLGQKQKTPYWVGDEDKGPVPRAGFVATTKINRKDFNISWDSKLDDGSPVAANDVHLTIDVEALSEK